MPNKLFSALVALVVASSDLILITECEATAGTGRDNQKAGDTLEGAAERNKSLERAPIVRVHQP